MAAVSSCYAIGTWKECTLVKSNELLDTEDEFKNCGEYCSNIYKEQQSKGYCTSFPSGYFCQCRLSSQKNKNTHQSCKIIDISKVVDNSDGLDTCEAYCRETEKSNTGTCISYITGWYCDCH